MQDTPSLADNDKKSMFGEMMSELLGIALLTPVRVDPLVRQLDWPFLTKRCGKSRLPLGDGMKAPLPIGSAFRFPCRVIE